MKLRDFQNCCTCPDGTPRMHDLQMEGRSVQGADLDVAARDASVCSLTTPPDLTPSVESLPITAADAGWFR